MALPYVISIIVTAADPDGVRVVEKSNWTGRGLVFSRSDLGLARTEGLDGVGIYLLLGDDPDEEYDRRIYIGQGENVGKRLSQHQGDDGKDFWDTTVTFTSGNSSLNRAHISYLEAELINLARSAKRVSIANGNQPGTPHLPASDHAVAAGFLAEMRAIFPVLGIDAFEAVEVAPSDPSRAIRYYLDTRGGKGEGQERSDGFLVFAGAIARKDATPSLRESGNRARTRMIAAGQLTDNGDHYTLTEDTLFKTPSAAALVLTASHINGRVEWRDVSGVTLKERQIERSGGDD